MSDELAKQLKQIGITEQKRIDEFNPFAGMTGANEQQATESMQTVTDFENSEATQKNYSLVMEALSRNKSFISSLADPASIADDGPVEMLRDDTLRISSKVNKALEAGDWSDVEKKAYIDLKSDFDKVSITGLSEHATFIKDYGIDLLANFETVPVFASMLFSGGGSATAVAGTQTAARLAFKKALEKTAAITSTKKGAGAYAAAFAGTDDVARQALNMQTGEQLEYSLGSTAFAVGIGAAAGYGVKAGIDKYAARKLQKSLDIEKVTPLQEKDGIKLLEKATTTGVLPKKPINDILKDLGKRLEAGEDLQWKDIKSVLNSYDFIGAIGGGEQTVDDLTDLMYQSIKTGDNGLEVRSKLAFNMYRVGTNLLGKAVGQAPGMLSAFVPFSKTAASLRSALSHRFDQKWTTTDSLVGADFSEVATRYSSELTTSYRETIEPFALNALTGDLSEKVNTALNAAVRGVASGDKQIDLAAEKIKAQFKKVGKLLKKNKVIQHNVENYIPRNWDRKAIADRQEEFAALLVKNKEASNMDEARSIVESMLDKQNQLNSGSAGHFFSTTRSFENLNDADFVDFLDTDLLSSIMSYNHQAGIGLAKVKVLGVTNEEQFINKWVKTIDKEMQSSGASLTRKDKQSLVDLYRVTTGENLERYSDGVQNVSDIYSLATRVALLPGATLSSVTEPIINMSRAGVVNSVKGFAEALELSFKSITGDMHTKLRTNHNLTAMEAHREMQKVGVAINQAESQLGNRLGGNDIVNESMQKANNLFFRGIFLDQWTKFVQRVSYVSGRNMIKENLEFLSKQAGLPETRKTKTILGELNDAGVDAEQGVAWIRNGSKTSDDFNQNISNGAARYSNSIILQPTAQSGQKPMWHSKPTTSVFFQLLGYPAAFTNTVLKGAAKGLYKDPVRNTAKTAMAAILMTETARWANWARSRGESESRVSPFEARTKAIARWGGFGYVPDSIIRSQKSSMFNQNAATALLPLTGPIVGDVSNLLSGRIIETLGQKLPGYAIGTTVLGRDEMRKYRKNLKELDKDLKDALVPEFKNDAGRSSFEKGGTVNVPNAPAEPDERINKVSGLPYSYEAGSAFMDEDNPFKIQRQGFNIGGAAAKGLATLINSSTDGLLQPKVVGELAKNIQNKVVNKKQEVYVDPDGMFFDPAAQKVYVEDAVKNILSSSPTSKIKNQEADADGVLFEELSLMLDDVKVNKSLLLDEPIEFSPDIEGMDRLVNYFSTRLREEPEAAHLNTAGLDKAARIQIAKLSQQGEDLEGLLTELPGISSQVKQNMPSDRRLLNTEEFLSTSQEKNLQHRTVVSYGETDFEIAFALARETGVHVGTTGQANLIAARHLNKEKAISQLQLNRKINQGEIDSFFENELKLLQKQSDQNGKNYSMPSISTTSGYINVKNPLVVEQDFGYWGPMDILLGADFEDEVINAFGSKLTNERFKVFEMLKNQAQDLAEYKIEMFDNIRGAESLDEMREVITDKMRMELQQAELSKELQSFLTEAGYDSIKYKNTVESVLENESEYSYILFKPEQFKSAGSSFDISDKRQTFNIGGVAAKVLTKAFSPKGDSGFFSYAEKAAQAMSRTKGTGDEFISELTSKKINVQQDELEWTGFLSEFKGKPKTTKDEVVSFLAANRLDVEEAVGRDIPGKLDFGTVANDATMLKGMDADFATKPIHKEYTWDGQATENYREVVLKLPKNKQSGLEPYRHPEHFPEDQENILAHVRFSDIVSADGKKILLIDEAQSDVHKQGSKFKYRDKNTDESRKVLREDASVKEENLLVQQQELESEFSMLEELELTRELTPDEALRFDEVDRLLAQVDNEVEALSGVRSPFDDFNDVEELTEVPVDAVPFKQRKSSGWQQLTMKRSLIEAAKGGYDTLALTTGQQQAARYGDMIEDVSGMLKRYDKEYINILNGFAAKYDAKVVMREVIDANDDIVEVPSLQITEQMRKDILTGLPQFAEGGQVSAYEIQTGDTLSNIAKQHGTTVEQLATDNEISDPNMIYAGRTINVPSAAGIIEPAAAPISMPEPEVAPSPTAKPSMLAEQVEQAYTAGSEAVTEGLEASSEAVTEGLEAVSTSVGKGVGALRRMLGTDLGGSGRTAENTAGSLRNSETTVDIPDFSPTQAVADGKTWTLAGAEEGLNRVVETVDSVVDYFKNIDFGFSSLDEVAKANAAPETNISDVKLPDFSSKGRTAENTTGATAKPKATEISMLGDMTIDQIADAVASPEVDLSDTSIKMPDFSSKGRTAENTAGTTAEPEEIKLPAINFKPKDVEIESEKQMKDQESLVDTLKGFYNASQTQVAKNLITFFNPLSGDKTEADYTDEALEALKFATVNALKKGKKTLDYGDYNLKESNVRAQVGSAKQRKKDNLEARMRTGNITPTEEAAFSVGGAGVTVEGDKVYVTDKYDFSKLERQMKAAIPDEYAKLRDWISNYKGNEFKSKIFVGTLKDLGL